jgi:hypothetical protein
LARPEIIFADLQNKSMPFESSDSRSSIQFSCKYNGHGLEAMTTLWGLIVCSSFLGFICYSFFESISNASEFDWKGIPQLVFFCLLLGTLIFSFGADCLWYFFGKEVIVLSENSIVLHHNIFGISLSRRFESENINGIFVTKTPDDNVELRMFLRARAYGFSYFKHGKVAFNSGKSWLFRETKTFRFGTGLTWDEAKQIVAKIHQRFPKYQYDWWKEKA